MVHDGAVKLQVQLQRSVADRQFKGPIDTIKKIVKSQGVTGLWRGFPASVLHRSNFFWMFLSVEVWASIAHPIGLKQASF